MHFIMNNTEGEYVDIFPHSWMTGGKQGEGGDNWLRSTRPIGLLFGWEAVKGLPFQQYGLQPLSPLLIKFNKAMLN
jgi:hypothetical protein